MKRTAICTAICTATLALTAWTAAPAWAADDATMLKLAATSGCMTCHHVDAGAKGPDGLPPIAPAWRDVAEQYRGKRGALDQLTTTVMTGSNPYASHWKGKVSGLAMPPNAVAITDAEARALVGWILSLEPLRKI